jgi:non-ribosomal peptide synthetase component F
VTDGVLAMAEAGADALAITSDGSSTGQLQTLVTSRDVARAFGDQPLSILREIAVAPDTQTLQALNHRARALALRYLTRAGSVDWVARFVSLADVSIVKRIVALVGETPSPACWCFCGA